MLACSFVLGKLKSDTPLNRKFLNVFHKINDDFEGLAEGHDWFFRHKNSARRTRAALEENDLQLKASYYHKIFR
jgi:hypothetical protein